MDKRLDISSGYGYSFLELVRYSENPKEEGPLISHIGLALLRTIVLSTSKTGEAKDV